MWKLWLAQCVWNWLVGGKHSNTCEIFFLIREKIPIDGGLSEWTEWSQCSTTCNKDRSRKCDSPYAMFGGSDCVGYLEEETEEHSCFFDDCCPGLMRNEKKEITLQTRNT